MHDSRSVTERDENSISKGADANSIFQVYYVEELWRKEHYLSSGWSNQGDNT